MSIETLKALHRAGNWGTQSPVLSRQLRQSKPCIEQARDAYWGTQSSANSRHGMSIEAFGSPASSRPFHKSPASSRQFTHVHSTLPGFPTRQRTRFTGLRRLQSRTYITRRSYIGGCHTCQYKAGDEQAHNVYWGIWRASLEGVCWKSRLFSLSPSPWRTCVFKLHLHLAIQTKCHNCFQHLRSMRSHQVN